MSALTRRSVRPILLAAALLFSTIHLQAQEKQTSPGTLKIGFLMDSLKVERWQTDLDRFQKRAGELGAEVLAETAEGDDELQLQQAEKLLASGVRVLVLVPHDAGKAVRIVSAAKAKHVPLLCYERLVRDPDVTFFIGVDASAVGYMQAFVISERAPRGNYVLIGGSPSDINAKILHDAQMGVLKPMVDRMDIKIVSDTWTKDWDPLEAYAHMAAAIEADLAAIIRILDGTQTMTVYKPLSSQAKLAAEAAVAYAKGDTVKTIAAISIGNKAIPATLLAPVAVTKDNVKQTVIKDGFQNLETIQKSLPKEKWPQ